MKIKLLTIIEILESNIGYYGNGFDEAEDLNRIHDIQKSANQIMRFLEKENEEK